MNAPHDEPRLAELAGRCRAMRVEVDRIDASIELLDRETRVAFARRTIRIRAELDQLELDIEREAAGL